MKKNILLALTFIASALGYQTMHANFTKIFIAQPAIAHAKVRAHLTGYVQRSFMRANMKKGNIVMDQVMESKKDHTNYVYLTPGTIFNEDAYIDQNYSKIELSDYSKRVIEHFTQEILKDANQTAYISAVVVPVAVVLLVVLICLAASENSGHNNSGNHSSYFDTKRALREHDAEKAIALANATVDKNLMFDKNTFVGFSNNHLNGLKADFKKSSSIPHWATAIGTGLIAAAVTRLVMHIYDKNKGYKSFGVSAHSEIMLFHFLGLQAQRDFAINKSWLIPVVAGAVSYAGTAAFLEYKNHEVNDDYIKDLPKVDVI